MRMTMADEETESVLNSVNVNVKAGGLVDLKKSLH